ncbi:MAG: GNAT family N-acetyltransferase [Butyrivibrio sp.]|nr:GNAT family N-acetyltransferase [Acetatifactor muris]MCM1559557.1 GNAT family N-acetyltransferase [Butyrivibrio sp.]
MRTAVYENLPDCAMEIRRAVFVEEQGFQDEFDETDKEAVHFVVFDEDETPAATCRVFRNEERDGYILGRFAVMKKYRGKNVGSALVEEAERYVRLQGGKDIVLHAQCQAAGFYKKSGFTEFGDIEEEQGCPHVWMRKSVK